MEKTVSGATARPHQDKTQTKTREEVGLQIQRNRTASLGRMPDKCNEAS